MTTMTRKDYARMYGPTTGDAVRLGDTSLLAEVEHDHAVPGDECLHGGGKTLRDGLGITPGYTSAMGSLDMLLCNALVIDPILGTFDEHLDMTMVCHHLSTRSRRTRPSPRAASGPRPSPPRTSCTISITCCTMPRAPASRSIPRPST